MQQKLDTVGAGEWDGRYEGTGEGSTEIVRHQNAVLVQTLHVFSLSQYELSSKLAWK